MTRIIFHIDVNSAYLSWTAVEQLKNGSKVDLREIPAIIGGDQSSRHGIVLAKSSLAKSYGIQTGEPVVNAFRKCPNLVTAPPNHKMYREKSRMLMDFFRTYTKKIEQVSVDECYMDFTELASRYPTPEDGAMEMKEEVKKRFGFTVNIGISSNKLLAKMASDFQKPDRIHTLFTEEVPQKMWPLPVDELFFVGKTTAAHLHKLGIHTIGELARTDPGLLEMHLKKHGRAIWKYANGGELDAAVFERRSSKNKGYGNETTLPDDVTDMETACQVILSLCETVGARLRQDNMKISVVGVHVKDNSFTERSRQTSLRTPTNSTNLIYEESRRLFRELWDGRPLRLIGVFTSKAEQSEYEQLDLFQTARNEKQEKLDKAIDQIRKKYGEDSVRRARFLDGEMNHMAGGLNKEKSRYRQRREE